MCKCVKTVYTDVMIWSSYKQKKQNDPVKWVFMQKREIGFYDQETFNIHRARLRTLKRHMIIFNKSASNSPGTENILGTETRLWFPRIGPQFQSCFFSDYHDLPAP